MREPPRDKGRLLHIQEAIKTILERAQGQTFESLTKDKIVYGGIVYYTMIIGEAAYKLSRDFVATYNQVDWDVIQSDLKPLQDQVTQLLESIDWEEWENNKPTI